MEVTQTKKRQPFTLNSSQQQKPIITNKLQGPAFAKPLQPFSILKQYTEQELKLLIQHDPSFMATDASHYKDKTYVRNMCEIYCIVADNTTEPLTKIQHFKIEDLEKATLKLEQEHTKLYRHLCETYGVNPKEHRSRKRHADDRKHDDILQLCSWGYVETFLPNILSTAEKISKKMYSTSPEMSIIEKAKYAHIFFLFLYTFNAMPYDLNKYYAALLSAQQKGEKMKSKDQFALLQQALSDVPDIEPVTIFEAVMLQNAYNTLFSRLPDNSVNIDMIQAFIDYILDDTESLRIKEFVGLLTPDEKSRFDYLRLTPIRYNKDVRAIKEIIFPNGGWFTDFKLFMTTEADEKLNQSMLAAWRKFEKNSYKFGEGVEPLKGLISFKNAGNQKEYTYYGYLYAKSPKRIRISDPNELWMMHFYLRKK